MKKWILPAALAMFVGAAPARSVQIGSNVSPTYVTIPSSLPAKITFQAVLVPVDVDVSVKETWQEHIELVGLNLPAVDAVLNAHHVRVTDVDGKIIFPRPVVGGAQ